MSEIHQCNTVRVSFWEVFLQRVLIDEWERLGRGFQTFLAENGLTSHMWLAARKRRR